MMDEVRDWNGIIFNGMIDGIVVMVDGIGMWVIDGICYVDGVDWESWLIDIDNVCLVIGFGWFIIRWLFELMGFEYISVGVKFSWVCYEFC